ncbi:MAG: hypothetical protein L3J88_13825 [Gammaproteobacteria bacterium]|nr:hypothetical protein [Gammaproteobacteria bacterium]MCF6364392.1 hypothetical protein [Gammaproteobacteria bacterium]
MSQEKVKKKSDLKKKVSYFLSSSKLGRPEVKDLLDQLQELGEVGIFGGMLRDLSLLGNKGFDSDIDIVIDASNEDALDALLRPYRPIRNKFGGYRLKLSQWAVDIWLLKSTWAFEKGYVEDNTFADLCKTTFFDWDGIVYKVGDGTILTVDGYFDHINEGLLDINLENNPNPMGNIVKAFRYREKYGAGFSHRLAKYIYEKLEDFDPDYISSYENKSHDRPVLSSHVISQTLEALCLHQKEYPLLPFAGVEVQPSLWAAKDNQKS